MAEHLIDRLDDELRELLEGDVREAVARGYSDASYGRHYPGLWAVDTQPDGPGQPVLRVGPLRGRREDGRLVCRP